MTSFTLTTASTISESTTAKNLAAGETGVIGVGALLSVGGGSALTMTGSSSMLVNQGGLIGLSSSAIQVTANVTIVNFGNLFGNTHAISRVGGTALHVINHGQMGNALTSHATISSTQGQLILENSGDINGGGTGTIEMTRNNGDSVVTHYIANTGTIANAGGRILRVVADPNGIADATSIRNSGDLIGGISTGNGTLDLFNSGRITTSVYGIENNDWGGTIRNTGEIISNITLSNLSGLSTVPRVINTGTISGDVTLYNLQSLSQIYNSGTITGYIQMQGTGCLIDNRFGVILGEIGFLTGDDVFRGGDGGEFVSGGLGGDRLSGGGGDDSVYGNAGTDTLFGGDGTDDLDGGEAEDWLAGGTGSDSMIGGAGDDTLHGDDGADNLRADAGNDMLYGGAGDDTVNGGAGRDVMTGGAGGDAFVFFNAVHSGLGALSDVIRDFATGQDVIDLELVNAGVLVFAGAGPFVGGGTASLTVTSNASSTLVNVDNDGNGTADMRIVLTGGLSLTAADFVL